MTIIHLVQMFDAPGVYWNADLEAWTDQQRDATQYADWQSAVSKASDFSRTCQAVAVTTELQ